MEKLLNINDMVVDKRFQGKDVKFKGIFKVIKIEKFTEDNDKFYVEDVADGDRMYYMTFSLKEAIDNGTVTMFKKPEKPELEINSKAMLNPDYQGFLTQNPEYKIYVLTDKYLDWLYFECDGDETEMLGHLEKYDFGMDHSDLESVLGVYMDKVTGTDMIYRVDQHLRKIEKGEIRVNG